MSFGHYFAMTRHHAPYTILCVCSASELFTVICNSPGMNNTSDMTCFFAPKNERFVFSTN